MVEAPVVGLFRGPKGEYMYGEAFAPPVAVIDGPKPYPEGTLTPLCSCGVGGSGSSISDSSIIGFLNKLNPSSNCAVISSILLSRSFIPLSIVDGIDAKSNVAISFITPPKVLPKESRKSLTPRTNPVKIRHKSRILLANAAPYVIHVGKFDTNHPNAKLAIKSKILPRKDFPVFLNLAIGPGAREMLVLAASIASLCSLLFNASSFLLLVNCLVLNIEDLILVRRSKILLILFKDLLVDCKLDLIDLV